MPFDIAGAKQAGYTDAEILEHLAPQAKFDVDGAKKAGYNDAEILDFLGQKVGKPASTKRTWGEALVTDPAAALIGGGAQMLQLPGQLQRLIAGTGKPEEGLEGWGKRSEEIAEQMKSAGLKAREQARSEKVATAAENGILEAAGVAAWETIKDPALLSTLLTQQIPQLAISGGVGTAAKGVTTARMVSAGAAKDAIQKTALKVGVSADIATGALLQGTDVGADAYEETYKYLVKNGTKPEDAHDIAVDKARQAAAAAAAISVATQNIPGAKRFERGLLGEKSGEGIFKGALKTGAGEAFTEGLEEGGGQAVKNLAIGQVDPTRQVSQGVGEAVGLGAVGGLGLGAPMGAIQGRAEAVKSQLAKDTEMLTGIEPTAANKDALVASYQKLGISREDAEMLAGQMIAENTAAQATQAAPTAPAPATPAPTAAAPAIEIPAGVDPQRVEEIEIEYINAGFSIEEAKAKALEQAVQEAKDVAEIEATSKQENVNGNVPTDTGTGLAGAGTGNATNIQQRLGEPTAGTEVAQPSGVDDTGAVATEPVAGEVGKPSALTPPPVVETPETPPVVETPETPPVVETPEAPPVVAAKATEKEIKASVNAARNIFKQNGIPFSSEAVEPFRNKDTGLIDKNAVLAYAAQQKAQQPPPPPKKNAPRELLPEDIDDKLDELYLDPEVKKANVIGFAKKLAAQGVITQDELDTLTRISKDRDMTALDMLDELKTTVRIKQETSQTTPDESVRPLSEIQDAYDDAFKKINAALDKHVAYFKSLIERRDNPKKAQQKAKELINRAINKLNRNNAELAAHIQEMRNDPIIWGDMLKSVVLVGGERITDDVFDAFYGRPPTKQEIKDAAQGINKLQELYRKALAEYKLHVDTTNKLLVGDVEAAIKNKIAAGKISTGDAPFFYAVARGNTKQALEFIAKRHDNKNSKESAIHRLVAKFLLAANITPRIEFYGSSKPTTAGAYWYQTDFVGLDSGHYLQPTTPNVTSLIGTLLHELVHSGTVNALSKAHYYRRLESVKNATGEKLTTAQKAYLNSSEYAAAKNIEDVFDWLVANHGDVFTNEEGKNYLYGATNPLELAAEIFVNKKLQDLLATISLPDNLIGNKQSNNAWQWFLSAIRKLLNISSVPNSALDQVMRATAETVRTRAGTTIRGSNIEVPGLEEELGYGQQHQKYESRKGDSSALVNAEASVAPPPPPVPPQGAAQPAPKKRRPAQPKKTGADKIIDRIDKSTLADETVGLMGELARAQSFDEALGILKAGFGTLNSKKIQALFPALTTSQIIDWVGDKIPRLVDANRMVERMDTMRMKMLSAMSDIVTPWFDYSKKYTAGSKLLSRTMHYTTLAGVDPTLFPNLAAAKAGDATLVQLNKDLASATTPKDKATIKGDITKRTHLLNMAYKLWDQLGAVGNGEGKTIYAKVKNHYKAMFDLHRVLLDRLIINSTLAGNENDASTPKGKLMAAIRKSYSDALKSGVYFPLMRYGNYWVSVGTGVNREFYMFESEFQRDQFVRKKVAERQKAGDTRKKEKMQEDGDLDFGNDLTKLRNKATESSEMLRGIFEMVDNSKSAGTATVDAEALKDAVYQMYLTTLPEKDFRKQWIHRKGTAGFSGDALRNFVRAGFSNSGHLSKLRYGQDITLAIDAAHDSLKGNPEKPLLEQFVNEIGTRTGLELNPNVEDGLLSAFANGVNQAAFVMYLTGAKSAVANMSAIPIFGYPVLASRYGIGKSAAKLASYMNVFNHTTLVTQKPNGDLQWPSISVGMSKHVQSNKVLAAAFEDAAERGVTEITRTYDLLQMSRMPSDALSSPAVKYKRAAINMMGSMFHASERMNREIMYMASFELAYEKAVSEGKAAGINGEAYNIAVDAAVKNTYDSMFNYSRFNRPRLFRSPPARIVLQFKMFPQQVSVYLVKNFWGMLPFIKGNNNKKEAAIQLFGTLAMTGLFAGVAGMPLYSVIMGVLQGLRNALQDDDEPVPIEERDLDLWFRNKFLPSMLGVKGAETVYRGLISEAGGDIASSTSLNDMWFREVKDSPSLAAEFRDSIFAQLGPGIALGESAVKAADDFRNGYISQGLEKLTPAMFRGMVTAMRWNEEGVKTKGLRAPIYDEEEVTKAMLVWKVLGFTPTDLSRIQAENFKLKEQADKIIQTKQEILNRINLDIDRGDDAHLEKEFEKYAKFLRDYPSVKFNADTILNSVQKRAELRAMANRGLSIPEELQGEIYPLLSEGR